MSDFMTSLRLCLLSLIVCSVAYPAVILGFASVAAPEKREGSLIRDDKGMIVGSRLLAQNFTRPEYFWPRPSAVDYDASATGGSNLSPTNPELTEKAREIIDQLNPQEGQRVPADLVSASGSGMDPHITLAAALFQVPRVAAARNVSEERIKELVNQHTDAPTLAAFGGGQIVNVLELNLALDQVK
jgi:potassium-transporting ATPase KdpC subunit